MTEQVQHNPHFGNAKDDSAESRGWVIGHFLPDLAGIRKTSNFEVKWGLHLKGDTRESWVGDEQRTTLLLLVSGKFQINLTGGSHILEQQGDYAMWGPGVGHSWEALEETVVITIRLPSI